jgi:hypothetical protein
LDCVRFAGHKQKNAGSTGYGKEPWIFIKYGEFIEDFSRNVKT